MSARRPLRLEESAEDLGTDAIKYAVWKDSRDTRDDGKVGWVGSAIASSAKAASPLADPIHSIMASW